MITLNNISKVYGGGDVKTHALKKVDLKILEGEFLMVLGPSGSGKSTMLNLMGALDTPTEGSVHVDSEEISAYSEKKRTVFRREKLGFVFQDYNLLQSLTAKENVMLTARLSKNAMDINDVFDKVGLKNHMNKYPHELSGGEQQRLSIARALVKTPKVLFCDEPTGSLDETTAKDVLKVLSRLNKTYKMTIILITHNQSLSNIANRIIRLNSGEIVDDQANTPSKVEDIHF